MTTKQRKPPKPSTVHIVWDRKRGEAQRPYRLWDAEAKRNVLWRNYSTARGAMDAALIEIKWAKVGASIEVYDCRTQKVHGTYTRKVNTILIQE